MIPSFGLVLALTKGLHIAALVLWCAGLIALPLMLGKHRADEQQADYARLRLLTHDSYIYVVTPAAVVAIAAGAALIFLRGVFHPWMFAKLVGVGALVCLHAWVGHIVLLMSERAGEYEPPNPVPLLAGLFAVMSAILLLVLVKPVFPNVTPNLLERPLGRQLSFPDTPI